MDQRPQVPAEVPRAKRIVEETVSFVMWLKFIIYVTYRHLLLWLLGSIHGFLPLFASHQLLEGFQS